VVGLGVNTISHANSTVNVYPNPSSGSFVITLSHAGLGSASQPVVKVYNTMGQEIFVETLKQVQGDNSIDLSNQPDGVYLYKITTENNEIIGQGKLVIQK